MVFASNINSLLSFVRSLFYFISSLCYLSNACSLILYYCLSDNGETRSRFLKFQLTSVGQIRGSKKKKKREFSENGESKNWWIDFYKGIHDVPGPSESADRFESVFKLSRKTFNYICALVHKIMSARPGHFSCSNGKHLSIQDQVAIALRRLSSGDSLIAVGDLFGAHHSTVSQVTGHFVESMEKCGLRHLQWPSNDEEITEIKSKIEKIQGFPNCLGAIDTTHITMVLPISDPANKVWLDRQETHSMLLQAVVDPDMKFRDVVTGWPGKVCESTVLESSTFYKLSDKGKRLNGKRSFLSDGLEIREYIVGDKGFPLLPWLITPYKGKCLSESEREFNRRYFATRMVAKRAFARLKEMWKIINGMMWRPDKHKLPRIILVCCMLHNIAIDMEDDVQDEIPLCYNHDDGYRQQLSESADLTASDMRRRLSLHLSGKLPFC